MTSFRLQRRIGGYASPVTKGKRMFVDPLADGRSAWARRWNDLVLMHANDLGDWETLSEGQLSVCRRAAAIECQLETLEGKMSASEAIDVAVYARLVGCLCRLLELIGVKGRAKPLDPQSELIRAMSAYPATVVDADDGEDEPVPVEEPGETE